jgi:hypothetical protein
VLCFLCWSRPILVLSGLMQGSCHIWEGCAWRPRAGQMIGVITIMQLFFLFDLVSVSSQLLCAVWIFIHFYYLLSNFTNIIIVLCAFCSHFVLSIRILIGRCRQVFFFFFFFYRIFYNAFSFRYSHECVKVNYFVRSVVFTYLYYLVSYFINNYYCALCVSCILSCRSV